MTTQREVSIAGTIASEDQQGYLPSLTKSAERNIRGVLGNGTGYIQFDMSGYSALTFTVACPNGNPKIMVESSNDNIYWGAVQPVSLASMPSNLNANGWWNPNGTNSYQLIKPGRFVRISQVNTVAYSTVNVVLFNGAITIKQQDLRIPSIHSWSYAAAAGGIVNTNPVGICGTNNASFTNVLSDIDLCNAGATDCEVIVRTNTTVAGGSPLVIWRCFLKAGTSMSKQFFPGVKGPAYHLIEVVLSTTATVYVNAQGFLIAS